MPRGENSPDDVPEFEPVRWTDVVNGSREYDARSTTSSSATRSAGSSGVSEPPPAEAAQGESELDPVGVEAAEQAEEETYRPVPLGAPEPDPWEQPEEGGVTEVMWRNEEFVDREGRGLAEPGAPERRPSGVPGGPAAGRRLLALAAVIAAAVALVASGLIGLAGGDEPSGAAQADLAAELRHARERTQWLERALERESRQRYAWEQWARVFNPRRYRSLVERAERRAKAQNRR